jgi:hypothetical protein
VSASAFEHERDAVFTAGCDEFLPKPFRDGDVFRILSDRLGLALVRRGQPAAASAPAAVSRARMQDLPADWRERFRRAVVEADGAEAARLALALAAEDEALAAALHARVRAYRFGELEELLG